jgi:hypothetical protein
MSEVDLQEPEDKEQLSGNDDDKIQEKHFENLNRVKFIKESP